MTKAFASDTELNSSHTNNLWAGPTFIMSLRAARSVNKAYLTFFSPFWSEHLLERGRLSKDETEQFVKGLLDATPPGPARPRPRPPGRRPR